MTGYFGTDSRPLPERLAKLPPLFQDDPVVIAGVTYRGEPKVAGFDNHAHTPERTERPTVYVDCVFLADGAAEALKLSRHWKVAFLDCHFAGGVEEPVDICRGGDLYFLHCDFESLVAEGRDLTLKGGARRVTFDRCANLRQLTLGEYSKYDALAVLHAGAGAGGGVVVPAKWNRLARPPVREVQLIDCGPLTVVLLHSDTPSASGDTAMRAKRFIPRSWVAAYFWARARFFKESNPAPAAEFILDDREL